MFSTFEWMMAMRYLRARRQEGFISVFARFSLLGIGLGVATLIIVMSVMNGFRQELLTRILGVNGHLSVYGTAPSMPDYEKLSTQVAKLPGVLKVTPMIEGQMMASANGQAGGADDAKQPVLVSSEPDPANGAAYVALADGIWRDRAMDFVRTFLIFDQETVAAARKGKHFAVDDGGRASMFRT